MRQLQVKAHAKSADVTLRRFRAEQGLRDWQPHLVLHDVDDTTGYDAA